MKAVISIGARFTAVFKLAEYLDRAGYLERLITFTPRRRLKGLSVTESRMTNLALLGAVNYASRYVGARVQLQTFRWVANELDRQVSRRIGDCDIFYGWSGTVLQSVREAKRRGAATIVGTGSAHVRYQKEIVEAEYKKFGICKVSTHPGAVEKAQREFEEADGVIVPSEFSRRTLVQNGISAEKIRVIPEPLTRRFELTAKEDDVFRIIVVGTVSLRKGAQYVLEAASRLKLRNSEVVLIGPVSEEFRPVLKRYEGQFVLAGPVSEAELARHFSQASVLVLASLEDGWGHVTLEAMSCGLPVIVSVNTGSADAVRDGVNGFVVSVCDASAIMEKLECLYLSPDLREEMGARNRARVSHRNWNNYGEEVTEFFTRILGGFGVPKFGESGAVRLSSTTQ
jgi:glycosyltransferase involved in cell wall biosynthesis